MRLNKYTVSAAIAILVLFLTINPVFSYQPIQTGQPAQPEMLIAARGCEGAKQAKSGLEDVSDTLIDVSDEGKHIRRAIDYVQDALSEVEQHMSRAKC